jgi:hypothetical protein
VTGARTSTATTWSTAARAIPCLRAAGGVSFLKMMKSKDLDLDLDFDLDLDLDFDFDFDLDFMVDYIPRDTLPEGRGW